MDNDVTAVSMKINVPAEKLYMLSNNLNSNRKHSGRTYRNYHSIVLNKGTRQRLLCVPNDYLKYVQRCILSNYLYQLEPSSYSTAYCKGKSLTDNAAPHAGHECVLKLDISHFFDSIDEDMVYMVLKPLGLSVPATVLLMNLCVYKGKLPQGAPTSPHIANLVMKRFDERIGKLCSKHNITYTRYCDDMTFSGKKSDISEADIVRIVRNLLERQGFVLNEKKTSFVDSSQQQRVTGIVVNNKPSLSRKQKREIRQEVYYCQKFGVAESIKRKGIDVSSEKYLYSLLGRISFAVQIEPENNEMRKNFEIIKGLMKNIRNSGCMLHIPSNNPNTVQQCLSYQQ